MCFCKKKSGMTMGKLILWMLAALGVAAAAFAAIKLVKKHLCRCGKGKKGQNGCLSDLDFCLDDEDVKGGCCTVVQDDNDLRSEDNAVVNSENRMLNIETDD
ncbi:MAG: hypothetical protein J6B12_02590 [Clostridia bacterium]|nr:hypothetical protein [Clostridia bacterium]